MCASIEQQPLMQSSGAVCPPPTPQVDNDALGSATGTVQSSPISLQTMTDCTLRFLSNATNETLSACFVGLVAITYFALGRVGLLLMGVAGGIVLHAQWEGALDDWSRVVEQRRRRENGLDIVRRIMDLRAHISHSYSPHQRDSDVDMQLFSGKQLDYSTFQPQTAAALTDLTDSIIRDYVKWWYNPIVPAESSFPNACRQTLVAFIISISNHLARKRPADLFLESLTNSSAIMIIFLNELSDAVASYPSSSVVDAVAAYLQVNPDSKLSSLLDRKHQARKLDAIAEDILESYLEPKAYNCRPVHNFLGQILGKVVLEAALTTMSKPEWINGRIIYMLEGCESDASRGDDTCHRPSQENIPDDVQNSVEDSKIAVREQVKALGSNTTPPLVVSKAQEAMDEAMKEAQRLTQMIQEIEGESRTFDEIAKKRSILDGYRSSSVLRSDSLDSSPHGTFTPTSSQSNQNEGCPQIDNGFDIEGASIQEATKVTVSTDEPSRRTSDGKNLSRPASTASNPSFTSFEHIMLPPIPSASDVRSSDVRKQPDLTLRNASICIIDEALLGDGSMLKSKPACDYFVQIEPARSVRSGWIVSRKYADFETLHEVLRRISVISGIGFTKSHPALPVWKGHTKDSLRGELERYLNDAVRWQPLVESECLKRFFEKDTSLTEVTKGFGWTTSFAFEQMSKGMFDSLARAPNHAAAGGKAIFGGVTGVFGGLGPKRKSMTNSFHDKAQAEEAPVTNNIYRIVERPNPEFSPPSHFGTESRIYPVVNGDQAADCINSPAQGRSHNGIRSSSIVSQQPTRVTQMERRPSYSPNDTEIKLDASVSRSVTFESETHSRNQSRAPSQMDPLDISPLMGGDQILNLPPLPSDIHDSHASPRVPSSPDRTWKRSTQGAGSRRLSIALASRESLPNDTTREGSPLRLPRTQTNPGQAKIESRHKASLSEGDAQMAVELLFAITNELYTLSSAWQIRKALLGAAKSFLLRPGNPQLENIRVFLQDSLLDANSSDSAIATHIRNLLSSTLSGTEERKTWPPPQSDLDKERLRVRARRALVERGMPQALTGVMGQAASREALGTVFDCLQVEDVLRGFMFGLLLQAVRVMTA